MLFSDFGGPWFLFCALWIPSGCRWEHVLRWDTCGRSRITVWRRHRHHPLWQWNPQRSQCSWSVNHPDALSLGPYMRLTVFRSGLYPGLEHFLLWARWLRTGYQKCRFRTDARTLFPVGTETWLANINYMDPPKRTRSHMAPFHLASKAFIIREQPLVIVSMLMARTSSTSRIMNACSWTRPSARNMLSSARKKRSCMTPCSRKNMNRNWHWLKTPISSFTMPSTPRKITAKNMAGAFLLHRYGQYRNRCRRERTLPVSPWSQLWWWCNEGNWRKCPWNHWRQKFWS